MLETLIFNILYSCASFPQLDHHPELKNVYTTVQIVYNTHDAGGLTELDFMMAEETEKALETAMKQWSRITRSWFIVCLLLRMYTDLLVFWPALNDNKRWLNVDISIDTCLCDKSILLGERGNHLLQCLISYSCGTLMLSYWHCCDHIWVSDICRSRISMLG